MHLLDSYFAQAISINNVHDIMSHVVKKRNDNYLSISTFIFAIRI